MWPLPVSAQSLWCQDFRVLELQQERSGSPLSTLLEVSPAGFRTYAALEKQKNKQKHLPEGSVGYAGHPTRPHETHFQPVFFIGQLAASMPIQQFRTDS